MSPDRDVVAEQTVALRAEVREAHAAWQADIDNNELERDYFEKLDRLDHNLAERGLERGEHIDEEVPLREFQKEEGMTPRWPWSRSEEETYVLEIDNPNGNGKLFISKITLDPVIEFSGEKRPTPEQIASMHHLAHKECFIANSVLTEIVVAGIPSP